MNTTLWIVQGILAAMFAMAGIMKSTQPIDKLVKTISWADRFSVSTVRFIGLSELLGAIGIIIPWALNILPVLTPLAATGLALIQLLAIFHHAKRKEGKTIAFNLVLLFLSAFIAYGRFKSL
jgi:putative oxidoreductase